jgi:hypothetical protein
MIVCLFLCQDESPLTEMKLLRELTRIRIVLDPDRIRAQTMDLVLQGLKLPEADLSLAIGIESIGWHVLYLVETSKCLVADSLGVNGPGAVHLRLDCPVSNNKRGSQSP